MKIPGVKVVFDAASETRTVELETVLGSIPAATDYMCCGFRLDVSFQEDEITSHGVVSYVHLAPCVCSYIDENFVDVLLANGWRIADG